MNDPFKDQFNKTASCHLFPESIQETMIVGDKISVYKRGTIIGIV
jgi:hypothetical protein